MSQRRPIAVRLARAAGLIACVLVAACQSDEVTRPAVEEAAPVPGSFRPVASPELLADLTDALDDAASRLAPSLEDRLAGAQLRLQLADLAARLNAGDAGGARRALTTARLALDRMGGVGERETVVSSAIRLVLDRTDVILDPSVAAARVTDEDSTGGARAAQRQEPRHASHD